MEDVSLRCHGCGHFGSPKCVPNELRNESCNYYLSWSALWRQQIAAIERAQRITYVAASVLAILAVAALLVPNAIG